MQQGIWNIFITSLFALTLCSTSNAQSVHGIFEVVKGDVKVLSSKDGKESPAKLGQKVFPKDIVTAGADSRAKIIMVDKNELSISPDSKIEIQSYEYQPKSDKKNVLLNIMYGKVRAKVNQKYEGDNQFKVKTPTAVAGVRGTDFFTSYNIANKSTQVVTFEGKVSFGQLGPKGQIVNSVFVSKGQTTQSTGGAAPSVPVEVPKTELAQFDSQSDAAKSEGPSPSKREPSGDPNKPAKDDKKEEKKPEDKKANPAQNKGPAERNVAGGTGSMLTKDDFANSKDPNIAPVMPTVGLIPNAPPPLPTYALPPKNDFLNEVIGTTKRKVNITVTPGP